MEVLAVYTWIAKPSFVAGLRKQQKGIMVSPLPALYPGSKPSSIRQASSCENITPAGAADGEQAAHEVRGVLRDLEWPPPLQCPYNQSNTDGGAKVWRCIRALAMYSPHLVAVVSAAPLLLVLKPWQVPPHQLVGRYHALSEVCGQRFRRKVQRVKRLVRH
jgi:hypothetical protein